mmetsp:Transcript_5385/g.7537  ORF Transcript_5385/g.7537 Transcript_5385/m.7537 type:complete len:83 (+) Transcript_5385:134-382(+)
MRRKTDNSIPYQVYSVYTQNSQWKWQEPERQKLHGSKRQISQQSCSESGEVGIFQVGKYMAGETVPFENPSNDDCRCYKYTI